MAPPPRLVVDGPVPDRIARAPARCQSVTRLFIPEQAHDQAIGRRFIRRACMDAVRMRAASAGGLSHTTRCNSPAFGASCPRKPRVKDYGASCDR